MEEIHEHLRKVTCPAQKLPALVLGAGLYDTICGDKPPYSPEAPFPWPWPGMPGSCAGSAQHSPETCLAHVQPWKYNRLFHIIMSFI